MFSLTAILMALGGLLVLVADIYAVVQTLQSGATDGTKILWVLLIFFMPVLGVIVWLLAGPRASGA